MHFYFPFIWRPRAVMWSHSKKIPNRKGQRAQSERKEIF
jgi:hypothetical protein